MGYYNNGHGIEQDLSNVENIYKQEVERKEKYSADEVREYLLKVVSGVLLPAAKEHGEMYVSFEALKQLVEDGYNIVKVLNVDDLSAYKIHIEYQVYDKENKFNQGFRRKH